MIQKKRLLILLCFSISFAWSYAQKTVITGSVNDNNSKPLEGVTVRVKDDKATALTESDGTFKISVTDPTKAVLIFSHVGFVQQEIEIAGKSNLQVVMQFTAENLTDVVVSTGYGDRRKKLISGSISQIKGDEIQNIPTNNFTTLLQGKVAGLNVVNNSGAPGIPNVVLVRGNSTLLQSTSDQAISDPLYVVDGVIMPANPPGTDRVFSSASIGTGTSPLAFLDPNEIESIDILKDAASAAIYGSRAANGVIIITTKKSKPGAMKVGFNSYVGVSKMINLMPVLGGKAERDAKVSVYEKYAPYNTTIPIYLTDSLNPFFNNSTDWQGLYFQDGFIQNYNIDVSGGMKEGNVRLGLNYYSEDGIMKNTDFDRYSGTLSGAFAPLKQLDIKYSTVFGRTTRNRNSVKFGKGANELGFNSIPSSLFMVPGTNSYGGQYLDIFEKGKDKNIDDNMNGSLNLIFKILPGLVFNSSWNMNITNSKRDQFTPSVGNQGTSTASSWQSKGNNYNISNILSYDKKFGAHRLGLMAGYEFSKSTYDVEFLQGISGANDNISSVQSYKRYVGYTTSSSNVTSSFISRLNYDYKEKYLLYLSMRADGSSQLSPENRWGYFPAISGAWNIDQEPWFRKSLPWISQAKIRASYGINAAQNVRDYSWLAFYNSVAGYIGNPDINLNPSTGATTDNLYTYGNTTIVRPSFSTLINPDLKWQTSNQVSYGVDMGFLNGRISVIAEAYKKNTKDVAMLMPLNTSTVSYSGIYRNVAELCNYGYEFSINAVIFKPKEANGFGWNVNLNWATNHNVVQKLPNDNKPFTISNGTTTSGADNTTMVRVGSAPYGWNFLHVDGVFTSESQIPVDPFTGNALFFDYWGPSRPYVVGSPRMLDLNGDYMISDFVSIQNPGLDVSDLAWAGDPDIRTTGGITNTFMYKGFTLSVLSTFQLGRKVVNATVQNSFQSFKFTQGANYQAYSYFNGNATYGGAIAPLDQYPVYGESSGKEGSSEAKYPWLNYWNYPTEAYWNMAFLNSFIEDASFLRVKNVSLGYRFTPKQLKKISINSLNVYANIDNLFTLTKYKGLDPETIEYPFGLDRGRLYPLPRRLTIGFNVVF